MIKNLSGRKETTPAGDEAYISCIPYKPISRLLSESNSLSPVCNLFNRGDHL